MKIFFTLFIFCCTSLAARSQSLHTRIDEYKLTGNNTAEKTIVLKMPYAGFSVDEIQGDTIELKRAGDIAIDIVFTDFPTALSLNQLNEKRFKKIFDLFPYIKMSQVQQTNYVRQMNGYLKERALTMFHGVIIKYRPAQDVATMKADLSALEKMTGINFYNDSSAASPGVATSKGLPTGIPIGPHKKIPAGDRKAIPPLNPYTFVIGNDSKALRKLYHLPDSITITSPETACKDGLIPKKDLKAFKKNKDRISFSVMLPEGSVADIGDPGIAAENTLQPLPDSTLLKALSRNRWKNITVVGDVTGSMYPYTAQLLIWLKLHSLDSLTDKYAFFNDGDNKPDDMKEIGSTGGIYLKHCRDFEEVKTLIKNTMLKGGGGDCPENNIEALLLAEKKFPEADCQVLIADNWANIKDKALVSKLTKPVRIVVCGAYNNNVNVDYLNLAYKTKGSLHLMENDLYNLALLHEGEILTIGKKRYKLSSGSFLDLNPMANPAGYPGAL